MNNIIKCKHCGHSFAKSDLEENIIPTQDSQGNNYINSYCPFCGTKIKERKIINNYDFYHDWNGPTYLQLHANRTLWDIHCKDLDLDEYGFFVNQAIITMENKYKNLKIYLLGRSGRHVCVEDNSTNRRRYQGLVNTALKLEQEIINIFNNKEV